MAAVEGFTDPAPALDRCEESLPDVLLLDLHMPGLDGFAVMDALRSILPADAFLPVLVLTADDDAAVKQRALAAGAKDFLTKPFDAIEVVLRVRNLLETKDLYTRLQRHNAQLQAELDAQQAAERRRAEERPAKRPPNRTVLAENLLSMVFQPIVSLVDGRLVGAEALARFDAEPRRPPNEWFAEANAVGRGVELEMHAVKSALAQLGDLPPGAYMSVNASPLTAIGPGTGFDPRVASRRPHRARAHRAHSGRRLRGADPGPGPLEGRKGSASPPTTPAPAIPGCSTSCACARTWSSSTSPSPVTSTRIRPGGRLPRRWSPSPMRSGRCWWPRAWSQSASCGPTGAGHRRGPGLPPRSARPHVRPTCGLRRHLR